MGSRPGWRCGKPAPMAELVAVAAERNALVVAALVGRRPGSPGPDGGERRVVVALVVAELDHQVRDVRTAENGASHSVSA